VPFNSAASYCDIRYKQGDEMRSMKAAVAEDKDYELRLLKVEKLAV
jgi:hypothetical protein